MAIDVLSSGPRAEQSEHPILIMKRPAPNSPTPVAQKKPAPNSSTFTAPKISNPLDVASALPPDGKRRTLKEERSLTAGDVAHSI